jgi:arylsulfatase B
MNPMLHPVVTATRPARERRHLAGAEGPQHAGRMPALPGFRPARLFLIAMFALLALLVFVTPLRAAGTNNILLIIADDYGFDSSILYNTHPAASLPPTPNLVALAQRGVLFRNAYASPLCSPTRACILTGQYGFRTGVGDVIAGMTDPSITPAHFTLPDAFAANLAAGYALAQFGKWHLGAGANAPSTRAGWTNYAGGLGGAIANYTNWIKAVNGVTNTVTNYATSDVVNDATNWIGARGTNKWFAWVAFNAAHTPNHIPPASLAPGYATNTSQGANRRQFEAMVEAMDTEIARLLSAVDTNKTDIIFIGDNGTLGGPQSVIQPPFVSTKAKGTLYEGGTRVPFFIAGPSVVNPGRTNTNLVHVVDLFSTVLELAGVNVAATTGTNTIDSRSLLPALQGGALSTRYAYVELFNNAAPGAADGRVLRNDRYKLIRFNVSGAEELYDLQADPTELTNLLGSTLSAVARSNYNALTWRFGDYQNLIAAPTVAALTNTYPQFTLTVARNTNAHYTLWRAPVPDNDLAWAPVTNAVITTNGAATVTLTDPFALLDRYYYRAMATAK